MNTDRFFYAAALLAFPALMTLAVVEQVQAEAIQTARLNAPAIVELERVVITARQAPAVLAAASAAQASTGSVQ
jgi:hypothetical protein